MTRLALSCACLAALTTGCAELPGEVVGTYRVTLTLEENSCGPEAVLPMNGKRYAVELRSEDGQGYWRIPSQTAIRGKYERGNFRFEYSAIVAKSAADAGPNTCRLLQSERLAGEIRDADDFEADADLDAPSDMQSPDALDAGADAGEAAHEASDEEADGGAAAGPLVGSHVLIISAQPGADCSEAVVPTGAFAKLPCTVRYALRGIHIAGF